MAKTEAPEVLDEDLISQTTFEEVYESGQGALPPAGRVRPLGPGEARRAAEPRELAPFSVQETGAEPEAQARPRAPAETPAEPAADTGAPVEAPVSAAAASEPPDPASPWADLGATDELQPLSELGTAQVALDCAGNHSQVGRVLARLALSKAKRVVLLRRRGAAWIGWTGAGEGVDPERVARLVIPPVEATIFGLVASTGGHYLGPFPDHPVHRRFLSTLGFEAPGSLGLFPIHYDRRASLALYMDGGPGGRISTDIGDVLVIAQQVPRALARLARKAAAG